MVLEIALGIVLAYFWIFFLNIIVNVPQKDQLLLIKIILWIFLIFIIFKYWTSIFGLLGGLFVFIYLNLKPISFFIAFVWITWQIYKRVNFYQLKKILIISLFITNFVILNTLTKMLISYFFLPSWLLLFNLFFLPTLFASWIIFKDKDFSYMELPKLFFSNLNFKKTKNLIEELPALHDSMFKKHFSLNICLLLLTVIIITFTILALDDKHQSNITTLLKEAQEKEDSASDKLRTINQKLQNAQSELLLIKKHLESNKRAYDKTQERLERIKKSDIESQRKNIIKYKSMLQDETQEIQKINNKLQVLENQILQQKNAQRQVQLHLQNDRQIYEEKVRQLQRESVK